jgi:hypothetical protein
LILVSISPSARNSRKEFSIVVEELLLLDDDSSIIGVLLDDQRIFGMSTRTSITFLGKKEM